MKRLVLLAALFLASCSSDRCHYQWQLPPGPEAQECWRQCTYAYTKYGGYNGDIFDRCIRLGCGGELVCVEKSK